MASGWAYAATAAAPPVHVRSTVSDVLIPVRSTTTSAELSSLPAVAGAVRLIASTIDQLDLVTSAGPAPLWLRRPRRFGSSLDTGDLIQHLIDAMVTRGAGYLRCVRVGESWRVDAIHPDSVQVNVTTSGVVNLTYLVDGQPMDRVPPSPLDAVQGRAYLLPIPYRVSVKHPAGTSPLLDARDSLAGHVATERHASNLFNAGTYTGGVLETDQDMTAAAAERYQTRWEAQRALGKVVVLGGGLRYRNEVPNPGDLQLIEARAFNQASVYMLLGIPPAYMGASLVGGQSSLSYSNAQDNKRLFRQSCLEAFTSQISDALSTLMPPGRNAGEDISVVFDYAPWEAAGADNDQP